MGGQQFGTDTLLIDVRSLSRVVHPDHDRGIVEAEAGIEWPGLIRGYLALQSGSGKAWVIAQKQTGAAHSCSRTENQELFQLVHGGYGLFGIVVSVKLRLVPRTKVERIVEIRTPEDLIPAFEKRISDGFQYGDCQFSIERDSEDFLHHRGIDAKLHAPYPATEIITEIDVPRSTLKEFLGDVRADFRSNEVETIATPRGSRSKVAIRSFENFSGQRKNTIRKNDSKVTGTDITKPCLAIACSQPSVSQYFSRPHSPMANL
jgi:hypothetical protein